MKAIYRIYQFCFSRVTRLFEHICPKIINGEDSLLAIPTIVKEKGIKKLMIVTTKGTIKRKTLEPLLIELTNKRISYYVYSDLTPDPTIESVESGYRAYRDNNCEAIVCVGGGSVMDCAKLIAALSVQPNKTIYQLKGMLKIRKKLPLFIAVPTTAGTGSEVTAAAVITGMRNGTHYKFTVIDYCLIPHYAILDPKLTLSLPARFTVTTGLDALTHALEAYTNLFASKYVKGKALEATKLILENIEVVAKEPTNIEARSKMLLGSTYAGIAFTNNFVGYVHALAHAIGGIYGVAHGEANSLLLTPVLRKYGKAAEKKMAEVADYCNLGGNTNEEKADALLNRIDEIKKHNDIPFKFACLKEDDYNELVERAFKEAVPTYPVPVIWSREQFKEMLNVVKE